MSDPADLETDDRVRLARPMEGAEGWRGSVVATQPHITRAVVIWDWDDVRRGYQYRSLVRCAD